MNTVAIVIPCYKERPNDIEIASIKQCYNVLGNHSIFFVVPDGLKMDYYEQCLGKQVDYVSFAPHFFTSIEEYSELLKYNLFYKAFSNYKYILIYQTDAWVFRDELLYWCQKGYDYIGAPWFEDFSSHEEGKELWSVGNGGFSLRKVVTFDRITRPTFKVKSLKHILKDERHKKGGLLRCLLFALGFRNTISYYSKEYWGFPEDCYFCHVLGPYIHLNTATPEEALAFAFEKSPAYLFELNHQVLPFGCHAWEKYDKSFWLDKVIVNSRDAVTMRI